MRTLILIALVAPALAQAPLVLTPQVRGGALVIESPGRRTETGIEIPRWQKAMKRAAQALESDGYDPAALDPTLEEMGHAVLDRFDAELAAASVVVFRVKPERLVRPMDLLHWRGKPLYLQKPVMYELVDYPANERRWKAPATALLISDPTADPEDAVGECRGRWTSTYYKSKKMRPKKLRKADPVDLLLVSAHGTVADGDENIEIGDGEEAYGEDFAAVKPRLAYFDSCSMGASPAFLEAFRAAGTEYYLAPIVSNEAGGSSTWTIREFFGALAKGRSPPEALFDARRALAARYRGADLLYKAFVFRIYRLN